MTSADAPRIPHAAGRRGWHWQSRFQSMDSTPRKGKMMTTANEWVEAATQGVELLAVVVMIGFIAVGTVRWLLQMPHGAVRAYERYRLMLARSLLLGLELLVAADIIRTLIIELTLVNLATLGLLVVLRTVLGWTLTVEVEGRWPWQAEKPSEGGQKAHEET